MHFFFLSLFFETKAFITYSHVFQKAKGTEILRLLCQICILIKTNFTLFLALYLKKMKMAL